MEWNVLEPSSKKHVFSWLSSQLVMAKARSLQPANTLSVPHTRLRRAGPCHIKFNETETLGIVLIWPGTPFDFAQGDEKAGKSDHPK